MKPGDIVNAKSGDYYTLLTAKWSREKDNFLEQARQYSRIAGRTGNGVKFYFEQKEAADYARQMIAKDNLENVKIGYLPNGRFK